MSVPRDPADVKLFTGMLAGDPSNFPEACGPFSRVYGPVDYESEPVPFTATDFYKNEMGENLFRKFYSFKNLIPPGEIVNAKYLSREIEEQFKDEDGHRRINIDPGYMCLGKLVLTSFKDHQHRIYLADNVYAECTLRFRRGRWDPWEWTFPDYRTEEYNKILMEIRNIYYNQVRG
ncbi:MAG: DUF4416 family protein [Chloroflexi bacterium]|nr:DUF4416 family protein [Chloroflexota bacterium]